ncbi:hypothetical protein [Thiothrix nivea]|uniref:Uncharacterized protein n=1 Tax=Thiothrix nivea (strain ATCC 35100 / DSM 5205 / JP2) TaxID=870187 RepID=A0A656HB66_THINJ|nr:hypothetical protein [Thiothrix nivea]EIJ33342.1 hypothetical protein Thini_0705 [Thiothrix nivea DSM 5205]
MSFWKNNAYPGDQIDRKVRETANSLVSGKSAQAVAIVVIDNDGFAHANIAMRGVGVGMTAQAKHLRRQLAERMNEFQDSLL